MVFVGRLGPAGHSEMPSRAEVLEKVFRMAERIRKPPTQEQRARLAEHCRGRHKRSVRVYFKTLEEMERYQLMAERAGYAAFTPWIMQMLANASGGSLYPPEYVEGLKTETERLRRWLESAREEAEDYKQQVRRLQSQRDSLLLLVHGLPNGPDVVARFLQQSAGAQS